MEALVQLLKAYLPMEVSKMVLTGYMGYTFSSSSIVKLYNIPAHSKSRFLKAFIIELKIRLNGEIIKKIF